MSSAFRDETATLALAVLTSATGAPRSAASPVTAASRVDVTPHDMRRLAAYAKNLVDAHLIADLLPTIARGYVLGDVAFSTADAQQLSVLQRALLVGLGLQGKSAEQLEREFGLPTHQLMGLFNKAVRRLMSCLGVEEHQHHQEQQPAPAPAPAPEPTATATAPPSSKKHKRSSD